MHLSNCQNHFRFGPFSDSCLSEIRIKTWGEESYIEELHAIPTKFRNKLFSFHLAQNYERKTNLIQRAYILT